MVNDPIADFLTRIKNGYLARKKTVVAEYSKMREELATILKKEGYIGDFQVVADEENRTRKNVVVTLQYNGTSPVLQDIKRVSKPGTRIYAPSKNIPNVMTGYGRAILSTSRGIMTDRQARKARIGGEIICIVW